MTGSEQQRECALREEVNLSTESNFIIKFTKYYLNAIYNC